MNFDQYPSTSKITLLDFSHYKNIFQYFDFKFHQRSENFPNLKITYISQVDRNKYIFFVLEYEDQILQSITIEFKSSTSLHFFVYRTKEYYEVSNIKFYKIIPLPLFIDCLFFLFTFLQETEYPDTQIWLSQNEFVIEQKYYKLRLKKG